MLSNGRGMFMNKKCIVYQYNKENLSLIDYRMLPPKIVSPVENTKIELIQRDIDVIKIKGGGEFNYFSPSIVSIQLNAAKPSILKCKELSKKLKDLSKNQSELLKSYSKDQIIHDSLLVYEFIECAQVAIIFSFTAIETFFNLSIPEDYKYEKKGSKNTEVYNKIQIERYISWKEKLKSIIPDIYKIEGLSDEPFWVRLHELIQIRNDIVHQKSTEDTAIVEKLLNIDIPMVCFSSIELISHVYSIASKNETIPECCSRFPVVSRDSDIFLVKKVSNLEPIT
jgi:hypothetical protein